METNTAFDSTTGLPGDLEPKTDVGQKNEVELLGEAGVNAGMVYEGDANGCPHCAAQILANAA